ncbi:MAG TPA: SRPBCC family protein [Acetobacteraceae bacterium]|nr:SRPBCC family protein [Acetobacteraceae bacterium]
MADRIEKRIVLKAPVSRVWRALTDYREFGTWFHVALDGPFVRGQEVRGRITWPGAEHLTMTATVQRIEPERVFSFTWHPYAIDPAMDYSSEPTTLVEFTLEPVPEGTLLMVVESGFAALPPHRRDEAFRMNDHGWSIQTQNIAEYVAPPA